MATNGGYDWISGWALINEDHFPSTTDIFLIPTDGSTYTWKPTSFHSEQVCLFLNKNK